jgi:RNA polymerase sigma-70 factor (ECF subfamily)
MNTDGELAVAAHRGDRSAFPVLVDRHLPGLCGFFRFLGAPPTQIDDLVQETFFRAFRRLETYDPTRSFGTWLLSIGRYLYYESFRKNKVREQSVEFLPENADLRFEEKTIERRMVEDALTHLSDEARLLVELRIYRDLPFVEIAELTGESEVALRVRFHRTLKLLRNFLERG